MFYFFNLKICKLIEIQLIKKNESKYLIRY